MKKGILLWLIVMTVLTATIALGNPPHMDDVNCYEGDYECTWQPGKGKVTFTLLQNKNKEEENWPIIAGDGTYGWISVPSKMEMYTSDLEVKGLSPNTWYLVTLQEPGDADNDTDNQFKDSDCLFGVSEGYGLEGYCDVALFKTDENGEAEVTLPTTSGLTEEDLQYPNLGTGYLSSGTYTGLTLAIKNVGCDDSSDCSKPDLGMLPLGGIPELFETVHLNMFTIE